MTTKECPRCSYLNELNRQECENGCGYVFSGPSTEKVDKPTKTDPTKKDPIKTDLTKSDPTKTAPIVEPLSPDSPKPSEGSEKTEIKTLGGSVQKAYLPPFLQKILPGSLTKLIESYVVRIPKPFGPLLRQFLGQRWKGWSVVGVLGALLSTTVPAEYIPSVLKSPENVGVLRWEGKFIPGEKMSIEKSQLSREPSQPGEATVSGAWPTNDCPIKPATAGGGKNCH